MRLLLLLQLVASVLSAAVLDPSSGREEGGMVFYDAKSLPLEGKGWATTKSYYDRLPSHAETVVRRVVWNLSRESAGMLLSLIHI